MAEYDIHFTIEVDDEDEAERITSVLEGELGVQAVPYTIKGPDPVD